LSEFTFNVAAPDVRLNRREMDTFLNSPRGEVGRELKKIGFRIQIAAKGQVGKDTGDLMRSIVVIHERIGLYQQIRIGSDNEIAFIHHEGTRPHTITARGDKPLRFSSNGRMVYTRSVNHPGTLPNRYLSDNLKLAYI
jgi:hypothetical protein